MHAIVEPIRCVSYFDGYCNFYIFVICTHIFEAISARVDNEPCVTHIGLGGSGHFVKMVHNGIEYGDMQLICEAYHIFKAAGFSNLEIADIFDEWNSGDLESYLIEITANIFRHSAASGSGRVSSMSDTDSIQSEPRVGFGAAKLETTP